MCALERIVALSWDRALYLSRVACTIERYERLIEIGSATTPATRAELTMRILVGHPSALLEHASIDATALASRLEAARTELRSLRAAAPLPPSEERMDRRLTLAVADLEWLMREFRIIRKDARRLSAERSVSRYAERNRPDPVGGLDSDLVRAIAAIQRGGSLAACLRIVGTRYGIADPRSVLFPGRPANPAERRAPAEERVYVCAASAIREGTSIKVEAFGREIAVFRDGGVLKAIDDHCPHRGGPLHLGDVDRGAVVCPLHSWAFDLSTGCMRGNPKIRVPTFEVALEDDGVFVRFRRGRGDAE